MGFFWNGGFEIVFFLIFFLFIGMFLYIMISNIARWRKNNASPRLTVDAQVVSKRTDISRHHHGGGTEPIHTSTSTSYYVTFQVESGDRMELRMSGEEYGLLAQGDRGKLSFQGTRYLGFQRT